MSKEKFQIPCALPCDWYNIRSKELDAAKKALAEAHIQIQQQKQELEAAQRVIVKVYEVLPDMLEGDRKNSLLARLAVYGGGEWNIK